METTSSNQGSFVATADSLILTYDEYYAVPPSPIIIDQVSQVRNSASIRFRSVDDVTDEPLPGSVVLVRDREGNVLFSITHGDTPETDFSYAPEIRADSLLFFYPYFNNAAIDADSLLGWSVRLTVRFTYGGEKTRLVPHRREAYALSATEDSEAFVLSSGKASWTYIRADE